MSSDKLITSSNKKLLMLDVIIYFISKNPRHHFYQVRNIFQNPKCQFYIQESKKSVLPSQKHFTKSKMSVLHPGIQNISFTKSKTFYKIQNVSFTSKTSVLPSPKHFTKSKMSVLLPKLNSNKHARFLFNSYNNNYYYWNILKLVTLTILA